MKDPHDVLWKFWTADFMAKEIVEREFYVHDLELWHGGFVYSEERRALGQILKREWLR